MQQRSLGGDPSGEAFVLQESHPRTDLGQLLAERRIGAGDDLRQFAEAGAGQTLLPGTIEQLLAAVLADFQLSAQLAFLLLQQGQSFEIALGHALLLLRQDVEQFRLDLGEFVQQIGDFLLSVFDKRCHELSLPFQVRKPSKGTRPCLRRAHIGRCNCIRSNRGSLKESPEASAIRSEIT